MLYKALQGREVSQWCRLLRNIILSVASCSSPFLRPWYCLVSCRPSRSFIVSLVFCGVPLTRDEMDEGEPAKMDEELSSEPLQSLGKSDSTLLNGVCTAFANRFMNL